MFRRIGNSWELIKASAAVLRADKELLIFPVVSAIGSLIVMATFAIPMFMAGLFDDMVSGEAGSARIMGYIVAYHTYGRWLSRKIFNLDPQAEVPSRQLRDDVDFVPTRKEVIFGHHFTSIAGTGPIVGPAIAVFWGWLPAFRPIGCLSMAVSPVIFYFFRLSFQSCVFCISES